MRHDITVGGSMVRLRPIRVSDAAFVAALRGSADRARHLHRTDATVEAQERYLREYESRPNDYYFVVEQVTSNEPEGLIGIYDVAQGAAEWGRWILVPRSLAAAESALLIYRAGFEQLGLTSLYCRTLADNAKVVSFHDSAGAARVKTLPGHFTIDGVPRDAIEHRVTEAEWPAVRAKLERVASGLARHAGRTPA